MVGGRFNLAKAEPESLIDSGVLVPPTNLFTELRSQFRAGGGWFMGSKDWGDPLAGAGSSDDLSEPIGVLAKQGFNVANVD